MNRRTQISLLTVIPIIGLFAVAALLATSPTASYAAPGLLSTLPSAQATTSPDSPFPYSASLSTGAVTGSAVSPQPLSVSSIAGSTISTSDCYQPGQTRTMCFTVQNGSQDNEWLDRVRLTFPDLLGPWTVACLYQDATDSSGKPVDFDCSAINNEVIYTDNDSDGSGEITAGSSWTFCIDLTVPSAYNGDRIIHWGLSGDEIGATPHETEASILVNMCEPLMLTSETTISAACNGVARDIVFDLWNNTGSNGSFSLNYAVPSANAAFDGPGEISISSGSIVTFTAQLTPDFFLRPGEIVTATLQASGNAASTNFTLITAISSSAGWQANASSPSSTMDNVVAWASHDGALWSIGGYGASGVTQRYDLETDAWTTHAPEVQPVIEYPSDGCYGLNAVGEEVIVLFPDASSSVHTLHRYTIPTDTWDAPSIPVPFSDGRWAQDILSLYNINGENICYISGGATSPGGGNVNNLFEYHPDTNTIKYLGNFTHHPSGFDFHASWYVPWIGSSGAVCVGGGIDQSSGITSDTQCYDIAAGKFNAPNSDLGPLPEPWWGMADGWRIQNGHYQIWLVNGVDATGKLINASAYYDQTTGGFVYGPQPAEAAYRLEGDGWQNYFFAEQGSLGGFTPSGHNQVLTPCPECAKLYLPLSLRNLMAPLKNH
jgi:hypothetical protein